MTSKPLVASTLACLLLTACNQLPHAPTNYVEDRDLLHSMVYTQRHLIALEFGAQPIKNIKRRALLLNSHCDLIHRDFVYAKGALAQCPLPTSSNNQLCMAAFHRCIGQCPSFKRHCIPCENQAVQCLKPANNLNSIKGQPFVQVPLSTIKHNGQHPFPQRS